MGARENANFERTVPASAREEGLSARVTVHTWKFHKVPARGAPRAGEVATREVAQRRPIGARERPEDCMRN